MIDGIEVRQLRSFAAAADTLHFGRAAARLGVLPAVLGRDIRSLEDMLSVRLFRRSTRQVELTETGRLLLPKAKRLVDDVEAFAAEAQRLPRRDGSVLRVGVIDSAAIGLVPPFLRDLHVAWPDVGVALVEDRTIRLLPQLLVGALDIAIVRPPERINPRLEMLPLLRERPILALPQDHPLAECETVPIERLEDVPMILPTRRFRPHSYELTMRLFDERGLTPRIAQEAGEKQTMLGLVAAGLGAAIVPRWNALAGQNGVVFRTIDDLTDRMVLPLAALWRREPDDFRDKAVAVLIRGIDDYAANA